MNQCFKTFLPSFQIQRPLFVHPFLLVFSARSVFFFGFRSSSQFFQFRDCFFSPLQQPIDLLLELFILVEVVFQFDFFRRDPHFDRPQPLSKVQTAHGFVRGGFRGADGDLRKERGM
jgi:hypothetical protein